MTIHSCSRFETLNALAHMLVFGLLTAGSTAYAQTTEIFVRLNANPYQSPYYIFSFSENGTASSLELVKGSTYAFIRTDSGHPFNIGASWRTADPSISMSSTGSGYAVSGIASVEGGSDGGGYYGTAATADGRLVIVIPSDFSKGSLAYYCYLHSNMVGSLTVIDSNLPDTDSDGIPDSSDSDDDGDGVSDNVDAFPSDASETTDFDADGIGDNADPDDDGDGVSDITDAFPLDQTETVDSDSDGIGNNADTDDDADGVDDSADAFPLDASESLDTDLDGIGNNADTDDDNDSALDANDAFPLNSLYSTDTDNDGMPNAWEIKYGLNANDPSDATSDQDNDGANALAEFLAGTIPAGSIDIDGNGDYAALTDGLLLLRGMFGLTGDALIGGAVASDALYTTSVDIEARIAMLGTLADIDGNGDVSALTDGLLALRYLFGLTGDALISGVIASDATRTTSAEIEAHIQSLIPAL